jgi:hypothetical protein
VVSENFYERLLDVTLQDALFHLYISDFKSVNSRFNWIHIWIMNKFRAEHGVRDVFYFLSSLNMVMSDAAVLCFQYAMRLAARHLPL